MTGVFASSRPRFFFGLPRLLPEAPPVGLATNCGITSSPNTPAAGLRGGRGSTYGVSALFARDLALGRALGIWGVSSVALLLRTRRCLPTGYI